MLFNFIIVSNIWHGFCCVRRSQLYISRLIFFNRPHVKTVFIISNISIKTDEDYV